VRASPLSPVVGHSDFACFGRRRPSYPAWTLSRERVLFIGTQFSNLYTTVDTPARGRVCVCVVFVCLVSACKYVLGHSRVSQPLNLLLCLLRHLGFLTSPHASPTCRRRRLNSYRLLHSSTPGPPSIPWDQPSFLTLPLNTIWSVSLGPHTLFAPPSSIHVPLDMFPTLAMNLLPPLTSRSTFLRYIKRSLNSR